MVEKEYVTSADLDYMRNQSDSEFGQMIYGMSSLLKENVSKLEVIRNQGWFKRMWNTVSGSNSATLKDIQVNHEKLLTYTIQALSLLFKEIARDRKVMIGLSNQINELYVEHVKLKKLLGDFADKLNRKIESIDNFFILNKEIEQGKYSNGTFLETICQILVQLDNRTLLDERKINIITNTVCSSGVFKKQIKIEAETNNIFRKIFNILFKKVTIKEEDVMFSIPELVVELLKKKDSNIGLVLFELSNYDSNSKIKALHDTLYECVLLHGNLNNNDEALCLVKNIMKKHGSDYCGKYCLDSMFSELLHEKILKAMFVEAKEKYYRNDIDEAYSVFCKLNDLGYVRAKWFLGNCFEYGVVSTNEDDEAADKLYYQGYAEDDFYAKASYLLKHKEYFNNAINDVVKRIYNMALCGDLQALLILSEDVFVENGNYDFVEKEKLFTLLQASSENDCWIATRIITHYMFVIGEHEKSFYYATKGTEQGISYCQVILAISYMWGYGANYSIVEAEKHCLGALEKKTELIELVKATWANAVACSGYVKLGSCFYVKPNMVESKLKNANESYVENIFGCQRNQNDIILLYDPTWFGGAKEGFVVYQEGIALNYKSVRGFIDFDSIVNVIYNDGYVTIVNNKHQSIRIAELSVEKSLALRNVIDNLIYIHKFKYGMVVPNRLVTDEFYCENSSLINNEFLNALAKTVLTEFVAGMLKKEVSNYLAGRSKPWYKKW